MSTCGLHAGIMWGLSRRFKHLVPVLAAALALPHGIAGPSRGESRIGWGARRDPHAQRGNGWS